YILMFGNGLHPVQWLSSNFMHAGIMHLLGNMFALWSFGLVVEGKLGWYKTLLTHLGIGVIQGAIVQFLMLGSTSGGGGLGASGIVFGLMAMSLVWAPENKLQCFFVCWILVFFRAFAFEVKIVTLVGLMLIVELTIQFFTGFSISSEAVHLIGAALGFAVAIAMLKIGLVDCENWDAFSVWAGRNTMSEPERKEAEQNSSVVQKDQLQKQQQEDKEMRRKLRETALKEIHEIICSGRAQFALMAHERMSRKSPDWQLPGYDLFALIMALHQNKLYAESAPLMKEYLSRYPENNALLRLKLAEILLVEVKRPVQALKEMAQIDETELDASQNEFLRDLRARAEELEEQEPYEIAD
ncbi:MAG: rhomboid family intramembrane serine protease, partial [Thermoguttaceae bacterium]